jgi:hypothetical protein
LLNDQWVIEEIREEIRSFWIAEENENTTYQNLCDRARSILRGKFITMSACVKRAERSQVNDLMLYLKLIQKQEQAKPKNKQKKRNNKNKG